MFSRSGSALQPGNEDGPRGAPRSLKRRQTTYDLPPSDPHALDFNIKKLERKGTFCSFLNGAPGQDPFPASVFSEPKDIDGDHDTLIGQIDKLHQRKELTKGLSEPFTRSSTWEETPSRTSSIGDELDLRFGRLTLGPVEGFNENIRTLGSGQGQLPGTHLTASDQGPDISQYGGSIAGDQSYAEASVEPPQPSIGPYDESLTQVSGKADNEKTKRPLRLGCPMSKAHPSRYEAVEGPCTNLKGITPTPKALMEHLKKHHSQNFRCTTCWKWFRNLTEVDKHKNPKSDIFRCSKCCKNFKKKIEFDRHNAEEVSCEIDEFSKPELFTDAQEKAFKTMKGKIAEHNGLERKWMWCFRQLWPELAQTIVWPYYDFAVLKHKLPMPPPLEELPSVAGGLLVLRRPASPASPSDKEDEDDSSPLAADQPQLRSPNNKRKQMDPPAAPPPPRRPYSRRAEGSLSTLAAPTLMSDIPSLTQERDDPETPPPAFTQPHGYPLGPPFNAGPSIPLNPSVEPFDPMSQISTEFSFAPQAQPPAPPLLPLQINEPFPGPEGTTGSTQPADHPWFWGDYKEFVDGPKDYQSADYLPSMESYWSTFAVSQPQAPPAPQAPSFADQNTANTSAAPDQRHQYSGPH